MLFVGNGFGDVINGVYVMGTFLENFVQQGFGSWGEMLEERFGGGCRRVTISGSDIVIKEESLEVLSAFEGESIGCHGHYCRFQFGNLR